MREKTFPWTKIKGNPRAMTVHIGLKTSTPDYWSRMTEGLQSVFRKKKKGEEILSNNVFDHENYRECGIAKNQQETQDEN